MTSPTTALIVLLGHPVRHSRSPAMMTRAFAARRLDAAYLACDVPPASLGDAVRGLRALGARGANVTIPHKRAVLEHCDRIDPSALRVGAANTLVRASDGALVAHNTDVAGVRGALDDAGVTLANARAVVLGAGGGARAAVVALDLAGVREVTVVARTMERGAAVVACSERAHAIAWGDADGVMQAMGAADVVVHATPLGMAMHARDEAGEGQLRAWTDALGTHATVMDMVYTPRDTHLLVHARNRGLNAVDGLGMLAHQGAAAMALWFGGWPDAVLFRSFVDDPQEGP